MGYLLHFHEQIGNVAKRHRTAQQQPAPENAELPWMMIQGVLHDDSYLLVPMKEQVLASIRANQLPTGGWPHPFGDYTAVWAAVLVVPFPKIKGKNFFDGAPPHTPKSQRAKRSNAQMAHIVRNELLARSHC